MENALAQNGVVIEKPTSLCGGGGVSSVRILFLPSRSVSLSGGVLETRLGHHAVLDKAGAFLFCFCLRKWGVGAGRERKKDLIIRSKSLPCRLQKLHWSPSGWTPVREDG